MVDTADNTTNDEVDKNLDKAAIYSTRKRLEEWRTRIIDTTRRNPLIRLNNRLKPGQKSIAKIISPQIKDLDLDQDNLEWNLVAFNSRGNAAVNQTVPEELVDYEMAIDLQIANPKPSIDEEGELYKRLLYIQRRCREDYDNRGINTLFLIAGLLSWEIPNNDPNKDNELMISPLILIPATIEVSKRRGHRTMTLRLDPDGEPVVNTALTLYFEEQGVELSEDWSWDGDKGIQAELREIEEAVRDKPGFQVDNQLLLGRLMSPQIEVFEDLKFNEEKIVHHPAVQSIATGQNKLPRFPIINEEELDSLQNPEDTFSPLNADGSQRQAIELAKQGGSFVLEGPPGTGKSQTIANIICEMIARGKSVLFVSEKLAALEIVAQRLREAGLDQAILQMHGNHLRKKEIITSLEHAINHRDSWRKTNYSLPQELKQRRDQLNDYADELHKKRLSLGNRTAFQIYSKLSRLHEALDIPGAPVIQEEAGDVISLQSDLDLIFADLTDTWNAGSPNTRWRGINPDISSQVQLNMSSSLQRLLGAISDLRRLAENTSTELGLRGTAGDNYLAIQNEIIPAIGLANNIGDAPELWLDPNTRSEATEIIQEARTQLERFINMEQKLLFLYNKNTNHLDLPEIERQWQIASSNLKGLIPENEEGLIQTGNSTQKLIERQAEALDETILLVAQLLAIVGLGSDERQGSELMTIAKAIIEAQALQDAPPAWIAAPDQAADAAMKWAQELQPRLAKITEAKAINQKYSEEIWGRDLNSIRSNLLAGQDSRTKRMSKDYKAAKRALTEISRLGIIPESWPADFILVEEIKQANQELQGYQSGFSEMSGIQGAISSATLKQLTQVRKAAEQCAALVNKSDLVARVFRSYADLSTHDRAKAAELSFSINACKEKIDHLQISLERQIKDLGSPFAGKGSLEDELRSRKSIESGIQALIVARDHLNSGRVQLIESTSQIAEDIETLRNMQQERESLEQSERQWRRTLGPMYSGVDSNWHLIDDTICDLNNLAAITGSITPAVLINAKAGYWATKEQESDDALQRFHMARSELQEMFQSPPDWVAKIEANPLGQVISDLETAIDDLGAIEEWSTYNEAYQRAAKHHWDQFVNEARRLIKSPDDLRPAFNKAFLMSLLENAYKQSPVLKNFRVHRHEEIVNQFRELDKVLIETAPKKLKRSLGKIFWNNLDQKLRDQASYLRTQSARKTRHDGIKSIILKTDEVVRVVTPCVMISPMNVSRFIDPEAQFDLVVFDEASQVETHNAINCLYRGKQIILAGDRHQLPPTNFWGGTDADGGEIEDEDIQFAPDAESILQAANMVLEPQMLRWHYRSRHQSLIDFSNRNFYKNDLTVFPSPEEPRPGHLGVSFHFVPNGLYDRGKTRINRPEAQRVAELVAMHAIRAIENGEEPSIGVIAFNVNQADAINEEIEAKAQDPVLRKTLTPERLQKIFVRNLESVQGDERDVIIMSLGFGKGPDGRFIMNFGPLGDSGGARRLNVAITRARVACEVVASVHAKDFNITDKTPEGVRLMRDYLAYAETGDVAAGGPIIPTSQTFESPLEEEIAEAISDLGYDYITQVGVGSYRIDLGVMRRGENSPFILAVECDGATYHNSLVARDRDRLRQESLEAKGWVFHRIWSTNWFRNRNDEIKKLGDALRQANNQAKQSSTEP